MYAPDSGIVLHGAEKLVGLLDQLAAQHVVLVHDHHAGPQVGGRKSRLQPGWAAADDG